MEEGMSNYAEYRVKKENTAVDTIKRFFLILAWVIFAILPVLIGLSSTNLTAVIYIFPVTCMVSIPFGRHTFKMTYIEYEYAVVTGVMRFDIVNGAMKRKSWFEAKIGDMSLLAPYEGAALKQAELAMEKAVHVYKAISSMESPDLYVGLYKNEKGEECVVLFEAINKFLKIAKFYNRNTVVKQVRY
ncbi:MAG: hypothetical protein FWF15_10110 [Oscillospiraceae bacterium]|nr:hypothetical protein [Oscillospiraceae bacterium]